MRAKHGLKAFGVAACLGMLVACSQDPLPKVPSYPAAEKGSVVDDYFGTKVADPYRWMEDLDSKPVADWVAAENKLSSEYLAKLPLRPISESAFRSSGIIRRSPSRSQKAAGISTRNTGLQLQAPVYMRASLTEAASLILDPNLLSPDGSLSLTQWMPSRDGKLLAYGVVGRRRGLAHVARAGHRKREGPTGRGSLGAVLRHLLDEESEGVLLLAIPGASEGERAGGGSVRPGGLLPQGGTPQSEDRLIYARDGSADLVHWGGAVTEDGRYLAIGIAKGSDNNNRLYYADLGDPLRPTSARR